MTVLLPFLTAFLLGLLHSVDLDHAMAVSAFVSTAPRIRTALGFGLRWGLGHSATVLAVGLALVVAGVRLGPGIDAWAERVVGLALVVVGLWSFRTARNLHVHAASAHGDHAHLHLHRPAAGAHEHPHGGARERSHHPKGIAWLGVLHGLAGSSAALALIPVTLLASPAAGVIYLIAFSAGVTTGMMAFAVVLARAIDRASARSIRTGRLLGRAIAVGSIVTGIAWLVRA
jgi:cytochrome c biogenesis protein CcdA